jgi:hypothetical protein
MTLALSHPFLFPFFPLFHRYLFLRSYLHSYFSSFLFFPSLSFRYLHPFHTCSIVFLSSQHILHLLSSPSVQFLFSLSSFPHLNLAIIFLSLALSLNRYSGISSVIHLSLILLDESGFFDSFLSCLLVCVFVSFTLLYIHPSSFCS